MHTGVCLGVLTVGILAILLAILMLKQRSNKGTVADFKDPPKHAHLCMGDQHEVAF